MRPVVLSMWVMNWSHESPHSQFHQQSCETTDFVSLTDHILRKVLPSPTCSGMTQAQLVFFLKNIITYTAGVPLIFKAFLLPMLTAVPGGLLLIRGLGFWDDLDSGGMTYKPHGWYDWDFEKLQLGPTSHRDRLHRQNTQQRKIISHSRAWNWSHLVGCNVKF